MKQFKEVLHSGYQQTLEITKVLFESKTEHQHLVIFENPVFGRVMALDGIIQTTEKDEFIYHEMLVHVPMFAHGNIKDVLIIGGGDGGILREVLRHQTINSACLVEIDAAVIDLCQTYFPLHSKGAFSHPKAEITIQDGCAFVKNTPKKYDLIICDSTDPIGPGESLFTAEFYRDCKSILNDDGIMVTQNGVLYFQMEEAKNTYTFFTQLYKDVGFYRAAIPSYVGGDMAFGWASDNTHHRKTTLSLIQKRFYEAKVKTKYYTPELHFSAFALPQYVIDALPANTRTSAICEHVS
ncbi:polyamine aminopropyltransferase [Facilibium subflavum]|uniref:polyamine aminopropyltransferase n=1 Tax=Facilibium subflavum TaxID=2219058 RepID=UPI000E650F78|nr:polyamine aminopropyltransferase [Facilibium subflavum]